MSESQKNVDRLLDLLRKERSELDIPITSDPMTEIRMLAIERALVAGADCRHLDNFIFDLIASHRAQAARIAELERCGQVVEALEMMLSSGVDSIELQGPEKDVKAYLCFWRCLDRECTAIDTTLEAAILAAAEKMKGDDDEAE